jgi:hypothetical protein
MELIEKKDFDKLLFGLLIDSQIESEKRTPSSWKKQGLTTEKAHLKMVRWQFINDIVRILSEINLVIALFINTPTDEHLTKLGTTKSRFYVFLVGTFFNLIHQVKDKLFRLLYTLNYDDYKKYSLEAAKIKIPKLIKVKNLKRIITLNIGEELNTWGEESSTCIGVTLKHRTKHHPENLRQ